MINAFSAFLSFVSRNSCLQGLKFIKVNIALSQQMANFVPNRWYVLIVVVTCFCFLHLILPQPMTLRPDPPAVVKVFLGPVTAVVLIMSSFVSVPGHTLAPISRLMALVWGNSDLMKDSKANRLVFGISKFEPLDPLALFETIPKQIQEAFNSCQRLRWRWEGCFGWKAARHWMLF